MEGVDCHDVSLHFTQMNGEKETRWPRILYLYPLLLYKDCHKTGELFGQIKYYTSKQTNYIPVTPERH